MSDQFQPAVAQPQAQPLQQSQQLQSQSQVKQNEPLQQSNGPQAVQIQEDDQDQVQAADYEEEVISEQDDQDDQANNQKLQQSQNQSKNNPSTAQIARQQSAVKVDNNSNLQNQPKTAQIARQQSAVKVENNSSLQKQGSTVKVQKQKSTVQEKQKDDDDDLIEIAAPKSKPVQDNKNQLASSNLQQSNDLSRSRNENPQPKKATLLKVAQEQEKPKPALVAVQNRSDVAKVQPQSKPKSKSKKTKSGQNKEPDYEILLYQKDNKKIYWTNQTDIHPEYGVDIGFRVGDQLKYHMPEIKQDNAGYVVKLFYNLAKQFFTKNDNLYLCFSRGGQKGKLQFARNLFYVMGFDFLENNVDIFEASGAVTICLQETKLYNEKFAESLDEFTNCQMMNLYKVEGFERIQDRDTIDIILQIIKLKTKSKEFPKITLADVNEKEVDKILKDYTKMNKTISKR